MCADCLWSHNRTAGGTSAYRDIHFYVLVALACSLNSSKVISFFWYENLKFSLLLQTHERGSLRCDFQFLFKFS